MGVILYILEDFIARILKNDFKQIAQPKKMF